MKLRTAPQTLAVIGELDQLICLRFNSVRHLAAVRFWATASRLGDGVVWYALMAALPTLYGLADLRVTARMACVGAVCLALYALIKRTAARPRPYETHDEIALLALPLDRYAFPSGHTMHAVAFTIIAGQAHPELLWVLAPFTALVAVSRIVLGLHDPSDVVAGGVVGASVAWASLIV